MSSINFRYDERGWLHVMSRQRPTAGQTSIYNPIRKSIRPGKDIDRPTTVWSITSSIYSEKRGKNIVVSYKFRNRHHAESWFQILTARKDTAAA